MLANLFKTHFHLGYYSTYSVIIQQIYDSEAHKFIAKMA